MLSHLSHSIRQYTLVTFNYWNFTLTDGALRMLVVLYFHDLGYGTLAIASLFLFYEFFGVVTNLLGGWLGARLGLNRTMNAGLAMQIVALSMLAVPNEWLTIFWVMMAQALSGIAKDLNKMSAKSAIKAIITNKPTEKTNHQTNIEARLYKWVALLTGSKNALKGIGFFLGGGLLTLVGFQSAVLIMASTLTLVFISSIIWLDNDMGKATSKPKLAQIFSKSKEINILSLARMFLFGARDIWFVVALPIYLGSVFDWEPLWVSAFLAIWVIGYGFFQSLAPNLTYRKGKIADGHSVTIWVAILTIITFIISYLVQIEWQPKYVIIIGLMLFGLVFAINSSLHSYLIVSYAKEDGVSLDVGFYYMANAMGRLIGTVLSGFVFQMAGFTACLWVSSTFLLVSTLVSRTLPKENKDS